MLYETKIKILKWTCFGILLALISVLQTAYGVSASIWDVRIDVLPFLVAAVAMFEDEFPATAAGCVIGIVADALSTAPDGLHIAYFAIIGCVISAVSKRYMRRVLPVCMMLGGAALLLKEVFAFGMTMLMKVGISPELGIRIVLVKLLLSLILSPLPYFAVKKIWLSTEPDDDEI